MNRQRGILFGMIGLAVSLSSCRSTRLETYAPKNSAPYEFSGKILGLPLMGGGRQLDASARRQREQEIDESLGRRWESRFVPISEARASHKDLLIPWVRGMIGDYDLAARLRINARLSEALGKASGCRYAVLPTIGRCASDEANILTIGYVIPAGMVIIYGDMPVFLGKYEIEDMPICTMTLIDLKESKVISEAMLITRDKKLDPFSIYPEALINGIIRCERIQQGRKQ